MITRISDNHDSHCRLRLFHQWKEANDYFANLGNLGAILRNIIFEAEMLNYFLFTHPYGEL